ncbi:MAG: LPS export ABC transporter permease LptF [Thermodesulfobacteria bacterium]|nr:LPS export ABC transporter permease LptF [Thermodesulfobacteriota bacterium]
MILTTYLRRQVLKPFFLVSATLSAIFTIYLLGRYLAQAAEGEIPARVVLELVGWRLLIAQEILLPVTFFFGMVFGLNRLFRKAEMLALFACGFEEKKVWQTFAPLILGFALAVAMVSLFLRPYAWANFFHTKARFEETFDLSRLKGGIFYKLSKDRTFFAQGIDPHEKRAREVFFYQRRGEDVKVIRARECLQKDLPGKIVLLFLQGRQYEFQEEKKLVMISEFESFSLPLPRPVKSREEKLKALPTAKIMKLRTPKARAEIEWRLAAPLGALGLALLGLGISPSRPREKGGRPFLLALLIFVFYFYGQVVLKKAVAQGKIPPFPGIFWAPLSLFLLAFISFHVFWRPK